MKTQLFSLLMLTVMAASPAAAQDGWSFSLSSGFAVAPAYLGSDDYLLIAAPDLEVRYSDRFFASLLGGMGYNLINDNGLRLGPILKYDFGRDEDGGNPLRIAGDESDDLRGLGDVDGAFEIGAFLEYSYAGLSAKVEVRQGLGGHEGLVGEVAFKYGGAFPFLGRSAFFSIGPEAVLGNSSYNSAFFDVDAVQAAASGLSEFDASGGLVTYGFHGSVILPITNRISLVGFGGYDRLGGDAANSSLVRERGSEHQGIFGLLLRYGF